MDKERLKVPESFDWMLSKKQRKDWDNRWNTSTPDGQTVMKAQLYRMNQWMENPTSVYDASRRALDASVGFVFHTDKSSAQWYLTGLDKKTGIAYGMRFFKGQAMLGVVDMSTILKETPLIFSSYVPGPLLADLRDLNIKADEVEIVDRIQPIHALLLSRKSTLIEAFKDKGWVHNPLVSTFTHNEMKDIRIFLRAEENDIGRLVDIGFALQTMENPHLSSSTLIEDKSYIYDKMNFSASDMVNEVHDKAVALHSDESDYIQAFYACINEAMHKEASDHMKMIFMNANRRCTIQDTEKSEFISKIIQGVLSNAVNHQDKKILDCWMHELREFKTLSVHISGERFRDDLIINNTLPLTFDVSLMGEKDVLRFMLRSAFDPYGHVEMGTIQKSKDKPDIFNVSINNRSSESISINYLKKNFLNQSNLIGLMYEDMNCLPENKTEVFYEDSKEHVEVEPLADMIDDHIFGYRVTHNGLRIGDFRHPEYAKAYAIIKEDTLNNNVSFETTEQCKKFLDANYLTTNDFTKRINRQEEEFFNEVLHFDRG